MLIDYEIPLLVSNSTLNGAQNVSSDGSTFTLSFSGQPLIIPNEAKNVTIECSQLSMWNDNPNIKTGVNDRFVYSTGVPVTFIYPQGLYDFSTFQTQTNTEGLLLGLAANQLSFTYDVILKRIIAVSTVAAILDFTSPSSFGMADFLGFSHAIINLPINAPIYATNAPLFNTYNFYMLHTDLCDNGIKYNNQFFQILSMIPINASPNSLLNYEPFNPTKCPANNLIGAIKSSAKFYITDDNNVPIITDENWSSKIIIKYQMPTVFRDSKGNFI